MMSGRVQMPTVPVPRDSALQQIERVLSSPVFQGAGRSITLLRFLGKNALDGDADRLKEFTIGAEGLGKGDSFDPRIDPIVRAEASRLRSRLERYYGTDGQLDPVRISLPKGSYVLQFEYQHRPDVSSHPVTGLASERQMPRSSPQILSGWRAAVLWLAIGAMATLVLSRALRPSDDRAAAPSSPVHLDVELRSRGTLGSEVGVDVALSPDGTRLVYVWRDAMGESHLNVRRLDRPDVTELPGTEGARGPFFSPDARWVAFWSAGKLKKTAIDAGAPVILCDAPDLLGGAWGDDGNIVAALSRGRLSRVPAAGGRALTVLDTTAESISPLWPQVLFGGRIVLFTAVGPLGPNAATI